MLPWTPERQAEYQRTIAMIRRSAERQAKRLPAAAAGLVVAIPLAAARRGDLLVRHADDSISLHRLVAPAR
jgi:hypothetical protein